VAGTLILLVRAVAYGLTPSDNLAALVTAISHGYTSGLNLVKYQYDRQSEITQMIDQNGTQHDYGFDGLGRQVSDSATLPSGSEIDNLGGAGSDRNYTLSKVSGARARKLK